MTRTYKNPRFFGGHKIHYRVNNTKKLDFEKKDMMDVGYPKVHGYKNYGRSKSEWEY